ncbi:MAG: hypothetical protein AAFQ39_05745 [Pseudomonadota bacterium]
MVGPSKILTVSYGTFSCTLEGFDDPFSTMKSIAEYFRDLAADDRYFGAEPPTPDAEMLHRIAEQEVQRRVEARVQDDGIVLRQMEDAAEPMPSDAPVVAPAAVAPAPVADELDVPVPAPADDGSIAAKLSRIRAVVARSRVPDEADDAFDAPLDVADPYAGSIESAFDDVDLGDEIAPIADIDAAPLDAPEVVAPELEEDEADSESTLDDDAGVLAQFEDDALGLSDPEPSMAEPNDITSRIIRLKRSDPAPAEPVTAAPDPEPEPVEDDLPDAPVAEVTEEAGFGADAVPDTVDVADEAAEEIAPEVAAVEEDAADHAFDEVELNEGADAEDLEDLHALDGADADDLAGVEGVETAEGALAEEPLEAVAYDEDLPPMPLADAAEDADLADALEPMAEEPAGDDGTLVDMAEDEAAADAIEPVADEPADDEDMLAAVAAAVAPTEADAAAEENVVAADAASLDDLTDADADDTEEDPEASGEAAFDRILEETNSKLDDQESSRRRSAIAHLKAAVAATKADRLLTGGVAKEEEDAEEQSRYRADLAKVVRPRRPEETKATDQRPAPIQESSSPLMLVSAQRVDASGDAGERKAVLPRRVNTQTTVQQPDPMAEGASSFADFAKQMGATELPDLLEAAAAYSAFVEGRREFSRPQLMRRVASYEQEAFTREAGLRSFGQLLRQGKIQKLKRGQFTITDETRFNPEARIAGE